MMYNQIQKAIFLLALTNFTYSTIAQIKTTKETKIIAVVVDNSIVALEHFENSDSKQEKLLKKYTKGNFFIGLLKGRYEMKNNVIFPKNEAIIILYIERQIFNSGKLFKNRKLTRGEQIKIGKTNAKVVERKKGELILRTNN